MIDTSFDSLEGNPFIIRFKTENKEIVKSYEADAV